MIKHPVHCLISYFLMNEVFTHKSSLTNHGYNNLY
jgi:hypothetical protein